MSSPILVYDAIEKKPFGTLETVMLDFLSDRAHK